MVAALVSVFWFVYRITRGRHWTNPGDDRRRPIAEALAEMPAFFVVSFVFVYIAQILFGLFTDKSRAVICSNCHKVKAPEHEVDCKCGGRLEPLENWHWAQDGEGIQAKEQRPMGEDESERLRACLCAPLLSP